MEINDHVDFGTSCLVIKERELKELKEKIVRSMCIVLEKPWPLFFFFLTEKRETMT